MYRFYRKINVNRPQRYGFFTEDNEGNREWTRIDTNDRRKRRTANEHGFTRIEGCTMKEAALGSISAYICVNLRLVFSFWLRLDSRPFAVSFVCLSKNSSLAPVE